MNLEVYFYEAENILLPSYKYTFTKDVVLTQDFESIG